MLAIDEGWTEVPAGFFASLDALEHPTIDWEYNLAQLRRVDPQDWQAFKMRLYRNMRQALDLLANMTEDWTPVWNELMGLS